MSKNLPNLPLLFDQLGRFLDELEKLSKKRPKMTDKEFLAEFDKLIEARSDSKLDKVRDDYDTIVNTIYSAADRGCPHGSTVIRG